MFNCWSGVQWHLPDFMHWKRKILIQFYLFEWKKVDVLKNRLNAESISSAPRSKCRSSKFMNIERILELQFMSLRMSAFRKSILAVILIILCFTFLLETKWWAFGFWSALTFTTICPMCILQAHCLGLKNASRDLLAQRVRGGPWSQSRCVGA